MKSFTISYYEECAEVIGVHTMGDYYESTMDNYNKWFVRKGMDLDARIQEVTLDGREGDLDRYDELTRMPHMVKAIVCGEWEGKK